MRRCTGLRSRLSYFSIAGVEIHAPRNRAMPYYNSHTKDGYRDAIRWLRKAASVDYDGQNTLGDAYT